MADDKVRVMNVEYVTLDKLVNREEVRPQVIEDRKDGTTRLHYVIDCTKTGNRICQFDVIFNTVGKGGRPPKRPKMSASVGGPGKL